MWHRTQPDHIQVPVAPLSDICRVLSSRQIRIAKKFSTAAQQCQWYAESVCVEFEKRTHPEILATRDAQNQLQRTNICHWPNSTHWPIVPLNGRAPTLDRRQTPSTRSRHLAALQAHLGNTIPSSAGAGCRARSPFPAHRLSAPANPLAQRADIVAAKTPHAQAPAQHSSASKGCAEFRARGALYRPVRCE